MLGYQELIIIFLIVLLLFGGRKIPEIAKGLGKGIREFRKARDDIRDAIDRETTVSNEPAAGTSSAEEAPDEFESEDAETAGEQQEEEEKTQKAAGK